MIYFVCWIVNHNFICYENYLTWIRQRLEKRIWIELILEYQLLIPVSYYQATVIETPRDVGLEEFLFKAAQKIWRHRKQRGWGQLPVKQAFVYTPG